MDTLTSSAVAAIDWYRRKVSPHKGFSCAYRVRSGGRSCAGVVRAALVSGGLFGGMSAAARQPFRCYVAWRMLSEQSEPESKPGQPEEKKSDTGAYVAAEGAWWCCFLPFVGS
jgi:putative component of membrane protein insertase Oxa1/YidC/SpoIIIJ protein YidD